MTSSPDESAISVVTDGFESKGIVRSVVHQLVVEVTPRPVEPQLRAWCGEALQCCVVGRSGMDCQFGHVAIGFQSGASQLATVATDIVSTTSLTLWNQVRSSNHYHYISLPTSLIIMILRH